MKKNSVDKDFKKSDGENSPPFNREIKTLSTKNNRSAVSMQIENLKSERQKNITISF